MIIFQFLVNIIWITNIHFLTLYPGMKWNYKKWPKILIIFQIFLNIIWKTKHSLFNSAPLHEMELHKMTKELAF